MVQVSEATLPIFHHTIGVGPGGAILDAYSLWQTLITSFPGQLALLDQCRNSLIMQSVDYT